MNRPTLSHTEARVAGRPASSVSRQISEQLRKSVLYYAQHPDQISQRLEQLNHEWNIERALGTNASWVALLGVMVSYFYYPVILLSAVILLFLFQQTIQGWCPPILLFRRMGFRTSREINQERYALKALRSDFSDFHFEMTGKPEERAYHVLRAVGL